MRLYVNRPHFHGLQKIIPFFRHGKLLLYVQMIFHQVVVLYAGCQFCNQLICLPCMIDMLRSHIIPIVYGVSKAKDQLIIQELMLRVPAKVLCKEDCKGICYQCGKNLNYGSCDCREEPKDPRMAAILDLFNESGKQS